MNPKSLVVVSSARDLPGRDGRNDRGVRGVRGVTADAYLAGGDDVVTPGLTVVNLCRSLRYRSKGYYVSLLADARGQRALPSVDTVEALSNREAVFRRLQEAGVETATPEDEGEAAETLLLMGRPVDRRFRAIAAKVHRLWPAPTLRLDLRRVDDYWCLAGVSTVSVGRLGREDRDALMAALAERPSTGRPPARPPTTFSIGVLYDERDEHRPSTPETLDRLARIAERMGVLVRRIGLADIARVGEYDALFLRTLTGIELPAFRFAVQAEALGIPVIDDTRSIIRCGNKAFLHEILAREGLPTPRTVLATRQTDPEDLEARLGLPFVVKVPDGSFSSAVFRFASLDEYRKRAPDFFRSSPIVIAQSYMPTEFDWRIAVLGGKVLFTCRYHMARGHWQILAPTRLGTRSGRVEAVPRRRAPRDVKDLARRAAALVGLGLYGVDIKETPAGPVVIEVNDNPNLDLGYEDTADGDRIYREVVSWFLRVARGSPAPAARPARANGVRQTAGRREVDTLRLPIGRVPEPREDPWRPFEVCGLELEYVVVDRDLNVLPKTEEALAALAGRPTSDVELGVVGFSNEIFRHVMEVKTRVPLRSLVETETLLVEGVRRAAHLLTDRFDARLLPTGMHPWFAPSKARLWRRSNRRIYETYERLFEVRSHGWANVQACHVNLPLGDRDEAVALVNAAALLTPYLPALAASSPLVDGEPGAAADNRLRWLLDHQSRIPESTGAMVPEYIDRLGDYRTRILGPMYRAVDRLPDAAPIRHEFLNARAAVVKFSRASMEVRVLDMQECVKMDVAIAAFTRAALKGLSRLLSAGKIDRPDHRLLVADFHAAVDDGTDAPVFAPHLVGETERGRDGKVPIVSALASLLGIARRNARKDESVYLERVERIVWDGNLSERIRRALEPWLRDEEGFTEAARRLYIRLADCLLENEPWDGRIS